MAVKSTAVISVDGRRFLLTATTRTLSREVTDGFGQHKKDFLPVSVIRWSKASFSEHDLRKACQEYLERDDVWSSEFQKAVLLLHPSPKDCKVQIRRVHIIDASRHHFPTGPLAVECATGRIFLVARLFPDTHSAFLYGIMPTPRARPTFKQLSTDGGVEIPVFSRLYYTKTKEKPLAGVRVAVKDTISLKGLRTGFGNKAWLEGHSEEKKTAPCIQQLLNAGAVIVGKVQTTEFAEGVEPCEYKDTVCPFNPRGDGHQKPSSSSSGSAAAIATYAWLDAAIGTDTGGSIRHPAGVNGVFGQRPTHGWTDLAGVLGASEVFDTVGVLTRTVDLFSRVGTCLGRTTKPYSLDAHRRKVNLLYPTRPQRIHQSSPDHGGQRQWFPHPEDDPSTWTEAEKQIESVVQQIERTLDCQRIPFDLNQIWEATPVIGQPKSLDEAAGPIYSVITTAGARSNGVQDFITEYTNSHGGRYPEMSGIVKKRLEFGQNQSPERIVEALTSIEAFKEWTLNTLFASYDADTTTLMIFPQSCGRPAYRDESPKRTGLFNDLFSIYAFGYLVGCPDYTIPVAEVPFESRITKEVEYLPVSLSMLGRPGSDKELFDVLHVLHKEGVVNDVLPGPRMYVPNSR